MKHNPFLFPQSKGQPPYWLNDDCFNDLQTHRQLVEKLEALHNALGRFIPIGESRQRSWHKGNSND